MTSMSYDDMPRGFHTPKSKWQPNEDARLKDLVKKHGTRNWSKIAKGMKDRNGKQCRERWFHKLCPTYNNFEKWSNEEEMTLLKYQRKLGNKWAAISQYLPGRSVVSIKNHWKSLLRRNIVSIDSDSYADNLHEETDLVQIETAKEGKLEEDSTESGNQILAMSLFDILMNDEQDDFFYTFT